MKINDKGLGMIKHFEDTGLNTKYSSSSIKHCNKCNMDKQRSSFNIDRSSYDGRQSYCNPCQKQIRRIYVEKNPEKQYYWRRKNQYKLQYGITIADYDKMFIQQKGLCQICKQSQQHKRLAVDHCHITKNIRGLLCDSCNRGIGLLKDDLAILQNAVKYIKKNIKNEN